MPTEVTVKTLSGERWNFNFDMEPETITLQNLVDKVNLETNDRVSKVILNGRCFDDNWQRNLKECGYDEKNGRSVIVLLSRPEPSYRKDYTGAEVKSAALKSGDIMFMIICDIAKRNPFYLSYLAINPLLAKKELVSTLDDPEFKLTIIGKNETQDPIKTINMHPSGDNGHTIDLRNVEFLIMNSGVQHDVDKAMEIYLWCDRDIQRTLSALQNPSGCPLLATSTS